MNQIVVTIEALANGGGYWTARPGNTSIIAAYYVRFDHLGTSEWFNERQRAYSLRCLSIT